MKAVIAFNQMNDVLFMHCDESFKDHVNKQALEMGILAESDLHAPLDPNIVVQIFSPLIMSQNSMTVHLQNPYHTITCEDGTVFVFEQLQDQIHLAVNGDGTESEDFMHRKLLVLQRLLVFLYGPVSDELRPNKHADRAYRWHFLASLLDAWCQLYAEEQSYLVEAVERLHVNQEINFKSLELLEAAVATMKTNGERGVLHALLLVNAKLLSLYSARHASELLAADILLMILLAKAAFPSHQRLEDLFSQSYSSSMNSLTLPRQDYDYESAIEENDDSEVEYFSSPSTPCNDSPHTSPEEFKTPKEGAHGGILDTSAEAGLGPVPPLGSLLEADPEPYQLYTVFLATSQCRHTPHALHCLSIMEGVSLIMVTELPRGKQANPMVQALLGVQAILGQLDTGIHRNLMDVIDTNLKKMQDNVKKIKGSRRLLDVATDVTRKWETAKENHLLEYLERTNKDMMPPSLESPLEAMVQGLKDVFRRLYISPGRPGSAVPSNMRVGLEMVHESVRRALWDYKDMLAVKALRNITITSYMDEFPGLVHFIYVNRSSHQMMAPSMNVSSELKEDNMSLLIKVKKKIWQQVPVMQRRLNQGYFQQSFHESDLLFTYHLWCEDLQGNQLPLQQPYKGTACNILPGILAGNFYRSLLKQCLPAQSPRSLQCFELVMVHVGLVTSPNVVTPNPFVERHFRKLAMRLWETTGEANSPISLLGS